MAHEEKIYDWMKELVIADKHIIGDLAHHEGLYREGVSSVNNATKSLNNLVDQGKLERGDGFYRLPGCKSEYATHAKILSHALKAILKLGYQTKIIREPFIDNLALRPDAIIFLTKGDQSLCFIIEITLEERLEYLLQKIHAWGQFPEAEAKLSELFKEDIKDFDFVVSGDQIPEEAFELQAYLEAING